MSIRLLNSPTVEMTDRGAASVDPEGRPDVRYHNAVPPTYRMRIDLEFEEGDIEDLRTLLLSVGYRL